MKKVVLMKSVLMTLILLVSVLGVKAENNKKEVKEVTYEVAMDCHSCVNKITKNLSFEKGVKEIKADMETQTVYVKYRADKTSNDKLVAALKKLGFEAKEKKGDCESKKKTCCPGHDHKH